jgi:peptidyl-prolyl cis-trans isomerase SurA
MSALVKAVFVALVLALAVAPGATAQSKGVIVVANDLPITDYDITQKMNLLKVLGSDVSGAPRKEILQGLINDVVKLSEARRLNVSPSPGDVDSYIGRIAKGLKMEPEGLMSKLKERGVAPEFFRRYVSAQIGFNRALSVLKKTPKKEEVSDAEVDRKMAEIKSKANAQMNKIMSDPRMKGVTVISIVQFDLPVEGDDPGLLQARAIESQQVVKQFKSCKNPRSAAAGVFNVKVGKVVEADANKIPAELRKALTSRGPGHAIGPLRGKGSLQVIGYCGTRKITPPKPNFEMPTREQVRNSLENAKFAEAEEEVLKEARKRVYIEYRDQSYATQ